MTRAAVATGACGTRIVHHLAVQARKSFRTCAQILVRCRVLAGSSVLTRLVGAAIVQILITEDSTPVGVADTLPRGSIAVPMFAARVGCALITEFTAPARSALAVAGLVAFAVDRVASCLADRYLAVGAPPAGDALLVARLIAAVVPELVIARAAEFGAGGVEVVQVALHAHAVRDARRVAVVVQRVPVRTRQDDPGVRRLLYDPVRRRYRVVVVVHSLEDEREGSRPSEDEGHDELAVGSVRVGEREGAAAQHGTGSVAEGAGTGGGDVALVLLEADAEERAAGTRAGHGAVEPRLRPAARARRQLAPVVGDLQDLQLEEARPTCAL